MALFKFRRRQSTTTAFFERYSESQWRVSQLNLSILCRFNQRLNKNERSGRGCNVGDDDFDFDFDFEG